METKKPPYALKESRNAESLSQERLDSGVQAYFHTLKNRIGTLTASILFCIVAAVLMNATQRPVYRASAELLLENRNPRAGQASGDTRFLQQDPTLLLTQIRMIEGPHLAQKVVEKLGKPENREILLDAFGVRPSRKKTETEVFSIKERQALAARIQRMISARQLEPGVRIIRISVEGYVPEALVLAANAAAETYTEMNYQSNMNAFRQSFSMISVSLGEIQEKIKTGEMTFQKIDSEVKLLEALKIYGDRHPLVIQLQNDVPQLTEKLNREFRDYEISITGVRKDLAALLLVPHVSLEELTPLEADLYTLRPILEQEMKTNREMYNSVFRKLQEVEVGGGGQWLEAQLIEPAGLPGRPVRPNKKMNLLLGLLVGFVMGTGLAFFLEYLDNSIRSTDDVRFYLKLFPFGTVPFVQKEEEKKQFEGTFPEPLDVKTRTFWKTSDPKLPLYVSEAYRIIRTNLFFGGDASLKVIQITSSVKGEGKTTTTCNLGISLAQAGVKTLLMDADLRRPSLHKILGLPPSERGLSDILSNGVSDWRSCVQSTTTPDLYCITAGAVPYNPAELLGSKQMPGFLQEVKDEYDLVLLDSPPVISVADSAVVATRVQGTILVSRAGFIPRNLCLHAKHNLESVNANLLGCILNGVQSRHQAPYYSSYYGNQAYHGGREEGGAEKNDKGRMKEEFSDLWVRLGALKEPFLVLLSSGWARVKNLFKNRDSKNQMTSVNEKRK